MFRIVVPIIVIFGLFWVACSSKYINPAEKDSTNVAAIVGPDYRRRGNVPFDSLEGILISSTGCEVTYTYFKPREVSNEVLVVLGHGFMRSKKTMTQLAHHLSSWGLSVVNLEFCNSKFWAGNHDRNGADMVAVAQKIRPSKVIYVGFSAGGLAAIIATNLDNNTLALFGLDMVDNKGLGKKIAPNLT